MLPRRLCLCGERRPIPMRDGSTLIRFINHFWLSANQHNIERSDIFTIAYFGRDAEQRAVSLLRWRKYVCGFCDLPSVSHHCHPGQLLSRPRPRRVALGAHDLLPRSTPFAPRTKQIARLPRTPRRPQRLRSHQYGAHDAHRLPPEGFSKQVRHSTAHARRRNNHTLLVARTFALLLTHAKCQSSAWDRWPDTWSRHARKQEAGAQHGEHYNMVSARCEAGEANNIWRRIEGGGGRRKSWKTRHRAGSFIYGKPGHSRSEE
jgi:hypothetical protein